MAFLSSTGCRVAELVGMDRDALKFNQDGAECIVRGKGNKERKVYLTAVAAMLVRRYMAERKDDNPALFVTRINERFQTGGIRDFLRRLEEVSGVHHIHPHKFRRTLATEMSRKGMPQESSQHMAGRKDGQVSVSGQRCKQGDGFPIDRLVMSINLRRISY